MGIDLESEDERVYKWGPPVILDEVMCFVYMLVHIYRHTGGSKILSSSSEQRGQHLKGSSVFLSFVVVGECPSC